MKKAKESRIKLRAPKPGMPSVEIEFLPEGYVYDRWRDVFVHRDRYVAPKEELARPAGQ